MIQGLIANKQHGYVAVLEPDMSWKDLPDLSALGDIHVVLGDIDLEEEPTYITRGGKTKVHDIRRF